MYVSLFMLFMLISGPLQPELSQPVSISVEQAVAIACEKNPSIQAMLREVEAFSSRTMIETALPETEIGFEVTGLRFSNSTNQLEREISFGLVQGLPYPGKLKLRANLSQTFETEAQLRLAKAKLLLSADVKQAYYQNLFNKKTVEILFENLELLEEIQKNAISRYALLGVPYRDVLRVKLEIARAKNDLLVARKELSSSLEKLNFLLGFEPETTLELTSSLAYQPKNLQFEELIEQAKNCSPTLQIAGLYQERAALRVKMAEKNRWPDLALGLFAPSKRWGAAGFSLGLSYPLFSRKKITGEKDLAEAETQKAFFSAITAERFYESQKKLAIEEIRQCQQQINIFEESLLEETEAELEKALNDYRLGRLDSLSLMDLYRSSSLARLEYYRSCYLYQVALADFEIAGEYYD